MYAIAVTSWRAVNCHPKTNFAENPTLKIKLSKYLYLNVSRSPKKNRFQLNVAKCKELRISFAKRSVDLDPILVNGEAIDVAHTVKLLGLNISSDLRWNCHVSEISRKFASRLYFLRQLKRANIPTKDLLTFYTTCVRPVAEYACPVFYNALPAYLSAELEKLQKRAMRIIFPFMPYKVALATACLPSMYERRETITAKFFNVISNPDHKLHSLLPTRNQSKYSLRNNRAYHLPGAKTNRLKNTSIYSNCR